MKKLFIFSLTLVVAWIIYFETPKPAWGVCPISALGKTCTIRGYTPVTRLGDCLCWNGVWIDSPAAIAVPGYPAGITLPNVPTLPGPIISRALTFLFPLAGIILFFYLVFGGFQFLTSGGDQKALTSAKEKLTAAIVGFILIFVSYWLMMIVEKVLGMKIL